MKNGIEVEGTKFHYSSGAPRHWRTIECGTSFPGKSVLPLGWRPCHQVADVAIGVSEMHKSTSRVERQSGLVQRNESFGGIG